MADTDLQQLVINIGTKAKIEAGISGGTITADMLSMSTDEPYVESITEGSTNGTIDVDGVDVPVHGLGSAAYTSSSDYATPAQLDLKQNVLTSDNAGTGIDITARILPDEYQLLEYLGANDTISLGFPTTNNSKIECSWKKGANNTEFVYQSDSGSTLTTNTTAYSATAGNWRFGNRTASINTSTLTDYLTVQDNTGVSVNGVLTAYSTVNTFTSATNLKLFQSSSQKDTILIRYFKHFTSGVLNLHLLPCKRIANDTYGFYDLVNGNFFTKEGVDWEVGQAVTDKTIINVDSTVLRSADVSTTTDKNVLEMTNGVKIISEYIKNVNGSSEYTWNFGKTFTNNPQVFVTRKSTPTSTTNVNVWVRDISTTQAKIYNDGTSGTLYSFYAFVIGA